MNYFRKAYFPNLVASATRDGCCAHAWYDIIDLDSIVHFTLMFCGVFRHPQFAQLYQHFEATHKESPGEKLLLAGLIMAAHSQGLTVCVRSARADSFTLLGSKRQLRFVDISVSESVGRYTADFLVSVPDVGGGTSANVECDGFTFHYRNANQVTKDRRRDVDFQAAGFLVMRYLSESIVFDPVGVARSCLRDLTAVHAQRVAEREVSRVAQDVDVPTLH